MARSIHIVNVAPMKISTSSGLKLAPSDTIKSHLLSSTEVRVVENQSVPNSIGNPTIEEYLRLEALSDYVVYHIDQTYIITYAEPLA